MRFGDQTFEEMMIGFFELADAHQDLTTPEKAAGAQPSRVEEFLLVLKATQGEPDDNLKAATALALSAPEWFGRFNFILPVTVPQVDRVCLTTVADGKLVQKFGPFAGQPRQPHSKAPPETMRSELPKVDAQDEPLAGYAAGDKPVVHADLSKEKGAIFDVMRKRGAKSSLHIPRGDRRRAGHGELLEHRRQCVSAARRRAAGGTGEGHEPGSGKEGVGAIADCGLMPG